MQRHSVPESAEVTQEGVERQARAIERTAVVARLRHLWDIDPDTTGHDFDFTNPSELSRWATRRLMAAGNEHGSQADHEARTIADGVRLLLGAAASQGFHLDR